MRRCGRSRCVRLRILDSPQPRAGHDLRQGYTVSRDQPQRALNHILTDVRHVRRDGVGSSEDAEAQSSQTRAVKGERGCHHEEQQDAQSPDVHRRSDVTLVPEEFRSGVWRRAAEGGEDVSGFAFSAETKVTHFDAVCGGVEDIFSFQVSVDDVVVMLKVKKNCKTFLHAVARLYVCGFFSVCMQYFCVHLCSIQLK